MAGYNKEMQEEIAREQEGKSRKEKETFALADAKKHQLQKLRVCSALPGSPPLASCALIPHPYPLYSSHPLRSVAPICLLMSPTQAPVLTLSPSGTGNRRLHPAPNLQNA